MNDLFVENITVVKNIDNFFLEFENQFAFSFQDVDLEIHEKEIKFQSDDERFIFIEKNRLFEQYFNFMSKKIANHLLYQLENKKDEVLPILFLQRQLDYSLKYHPEKRKNSLINDYKVIYIAGGDDRILYESYLYSEYEKKILKKAFESYKMQYVKIISKVKQLLKLYVVNNSSFIEEKQKKQIESKEMLMLFENLKSIGLFKLQKTSILNERQQNLIINLIKTKNNIPYTIALFHHIGFLDHLEQNVFRKKDALHKKLSNILGIDKSGRTIRGLINCFKPKSKENLSKYTSNNHLLDATEDFKAILEEEI